MDASIVISPQDSSRSWIQVEPVSRKDERGEALVALSMGLGSGFMDNVSVTCDRFYPRDTFLNCWWNTNQGY